MYVLYTEVDNEYLYRKYLPLSIPDTAFLPGLNDVLEYSSEEAAEEEASRINERKGSNPEGTVWVKRLDLAERDEECWNKSIIFGALMPNTAYMPNRTKKTDTIVLLATEFYEKLSKLPGFDGRRWVVRNSYLTEEIGGKDYRWHLDFNSWENIGIAFGWLVDQGLLPDMSYDLSCMISRKTREGLVSEAYNSVWEALLGEIVD